MSDDRLISSLRAFNVPTANRNITAINQPLADLRNLVVVVTQLKQGVDSLGGTRGGAYDRAVTFKDLSTLGLVSFKEVTSGSIPPEIGQNGGPFLPLIGGTLTGPLTINTNDGLPLATPVANTMLQLVGPDGGQPRIFLDTFSSTGSANVSFRTARGTRSAPTALRSGDEMLRVTALGYGATAYSTTQRGMLRFTAAEDWSDTAQGTRFSISTVAAGGVVSAVVATFDNTAVSLAENLALTGPDLVGGGRTTEARIAPNRFFFRQPVGDDSSAGTIDYRGYDPTGLSIVGAGTASGNHLVRLYDNVIIAGVTTLTGGATSLTPAAADNSTKVATTAFVNSAIATGGGAFLPLTGGALSGPGNLTVGGTLGVTGDATFAGSLGVDGNLNVTTALLRLLGADFAGGGATNTARFAPNRWIFRQKIGDDINAGAIDYRGYDAGSLSIVGAGTTAGNRIIRLLDNVVIPGTLSVIGATTLVTATATTPTTADNSTLVATTAFVKAQGYLAGNQTITLSGDASGTGTTAIPVVLATVNANVGTFQGLTLDAKGRVTAAVNQNYATTAALAGYLLLAGGTMTGDITLSQTGGSSLRFGTEARIYDDGNLHINTDTILWLGHDAVGSILSARFQTSNFSGALNVAGATTLATATATTPATADNSTNVATTAFVKAQGYVTGGPYLPLTGGTISGAFSVSGMTTLATATATTPATADNSTSLATTAFVKAQGYASGGPFLPLTGGTISGALTVTGITTMGNWLALNGADLPGGGRTTEARFAPNRLLFRQPVGDDASAGTIDYRGYDAAALSIVGAGTVAGNRLVRLYDNVVIPGTLAVTGATTLALATATTPATADNSTNVATTAYVKAQGYTGNQTITLSGDASGTGTTAIATTLATVNANVGTFQGITVNAKGLVTAAVNQNYATTAALAGYLPLTGGTISGTLGVGGAAQARLYVFGTTQGTPAINTAGVLPYLMLDDVNTGVGAGGGIIFSAATGAWRFAAIVGYATNGGNNSQGEIVFSTRRLATDATLTEAMRIRGNGVTTHNAPVICTSIGSPAIGQFHMAGNAAGTGYGSFWYNDGSVTYLLLTANNDALGSYNGLRPFMVDNATGLVAIGHGINITGLTQILSSSATNVLKIVNAGGQNLQIFDDTNEHIEASNVLWINGNTHVATNFGGQISVAGSIASTGANAAFAFDDRTGTSPTGWVWYAHDGKGTLYNNVGGDVFSVGVNGAMTTFGNVNGVNNKFFFWKDTGGTFRQGFGMGTDNNYIISDGLRYILLNGWTVPVADNTLKCGEPGRAWNIVQSYAFTNSSDRRLKRDIEALPADCLGLVRAIDPVQFRWRQGLDSDRQHWGFVAQDVGAAMHARGIDFGGHVIGDDPDATEALSVTEMIAVLWRAVQELAGRTA